MVEVETLRYSEDVFNVEPNQFILLSWNSRISLACQCCVSVYYGHHEIIVKQNFLYITGPEQYIVRKMPDHLYKNSVFLLNYKVANRV